MSYLNNVFMDYFKDLTFIMADQVPRCETRIDQHFRDFCNLQLCWRGPMYFGIDGETASGTASGGGGCLLR